MGLEDEWSKPSVFRIDGLSALGLNICCALIAMPSTKLDSGISWMALAENHNGAGAADPPAV